MALCMGYFLLKDGITVVSQYSIRHIVWQTIAI